VKAEPVGQLGQIGDLDVERVGIGWPFSARPLHIGRSKPYFGRGS
jgi:hypothetical protein